jgi:F0F1-type ATP synthase assembly protein I
MISSELLKLIGVWSLIPTYTLAGGLIGYGLDRWLGTFPLVTGAGILVAFGFAIRDMLRLRDEIFGKKQ